jgi:chorismate mutase
VPISGCVPRPARMGSGDALAGLAVRRLALANDVAAAKFSSGQPIEDPVRERMILHSVSCALKDTGRYQELGMRFFRDQIEANKIIQHGLHQQWHDHAEELPATHRDLAAELRPELDSITTQMIRQFTSMRETPRPSFGYIEDLLARNLLHDTASAAAFELRREAAIIALRSLFTRP